MDDDKNKRKNFQIVNKCNFLTRPLTGEKAGHTSTQNYIITKGRIQKFMLGKLVDFSVRWVGGVSLVH